RPQSADEPARRPDRRGRDRSAGSARRAHARVAERIARGSSRRSPIGNLVPGQPMTKSKSKAAYMISAVAEQYAIHPQTLRLYEREGLLKPSRSDGNTRLYTEDDLERLEVILHLTRDLGVNLAGVEIIMN